MALSASVVVGLFDPGQDRHPQFLTGGPALPVQDVVLEHGDMGLHGGVVRARPDSAHRPAEIVVGELVHNVPGLKLTAVVAMDHAPSRCAAAGHRGPVGRDR